MGRAHIALLLLFIFEDVRSSFSEDRPQPEIVGGIEASEGSFPYQVFILTESDGLVCTGSIVSEEYILTSLHCSSLFIIERAIVGAGNIRLSTSSPTVLKRITERKVNPDCSLTLLKLESKLEFTSGSISAVNLRQTDVENGTTCTISGWGAMSTRDVYPTTLRYANVTISSYDVCPIPGRICTDVTEGREDPCFGDSGGPLMCDGELTGVITEFYTCFYVNYSSVYAEVAYCNSWIQENMKSGQGNSVPAVLIIAICGLITMSMKNKVGQ